MRSDDLDDITVDDDLGTWEIVLICLALIFYMVISPIVLLCWGCKTMCTKLKNKLFK